MGIESMLTLAVALVIVAAAVALRGLVLGLYRLGTRAYRRSREPNGRHRARRLEEALPRITMRERAAGVGRAVTALAQYVAAVTAPAVRRVRGEVRTTSVATARVARSEWDRFYRWLRIETEDAYSGKRGRATFQAIGESPTTWGGRPHAVLGRR